MTLLVVSLKNKEKDWIEQSQIAFLEALKKHVDHTLSVWTCKTTYFKCESDKRLLQ